MTGSKVILQLPISDWSKLAGFVEACLEAQASLIAIVGDNCAAIEDEIDRLIVRDGSDESRFITTTSHPGEALEDVVEFATWWGDADAPTRVVSI